jgi:transposase-like protein
MTKNNQTFKPTKKQRDVVEMLIYSGKTQRSIAIELGMDETTISKWLNKHDEFQTYYNQELEKAKNYRQQKYKRYAQRAVDRLIDLLDAENENVQLASAKEILDRAGDKPIEQLEIKEIETSWFTDDAEEVK